MQDQEAGGGGQGASSSASAALELVRSELTSTLVAVVAAGSSRDEIRQAVKPLCARVREERMDVAHLVKLVKQTFAASAVGAKLDGAERQQILDRFISVCIDEYYAAR